MTREEVLQVMGLVKARYSDRFKHNPATEEMWAMVLDDVPLEACKPVLATWFKSEDWPPDPAAIRGAVRDAASALPSVDDAWLAVVDRIKSTYPGFRADPWVVEPEIVEAVRRVGGIHAIRHSDRPGEMENRFRKAYRDLRDRADVQVTNSVLELGAARTAIDVSTTSERN